MDTQTNLPAAAISASAIGETAPDGAAERRRVPLATALLFSVANIGSNLVFALFNFALPLYLNSYHLPPQVIGLLANERSLIGGFIQPIVGRLSDRTRTRLGRRRPFFLVGVPLMAVALITLGLHPPFAVMIILVTISGFFLFIAVDPYLALMADMTPPEQRGQIGGLMGLAAMSGSILVNLAAALLWKQHQFAVFLIVAVSLVLTFGITFITVPEPTTPFAAPRIPRNPLHYLGEVLHDRELTKYIIALALYYLGAGGATPYVTLFATKALGVPTSAAFILVITIVLSTALGAVPIGMLADRVGKKPVLTAGFVLFALGTLGGSQVPTVAWAIPAMIIVGLGNAGPTVLNVPLLADLIPAQRTGEYIGLGSCVWSIAQPVGALCAGLLVDNTLPFTYRHTFLWAGVLISCAAIVLLTVRPARDRQ